MDDVTYYSPDYNVGYILLGPHIAFSVIASIFVGLRTYTARKVLKAPWAVDEYVSIVALVSFLRALFTSLGRKLTKPEIGSKSHHASV